MNYLIDTHILLWAIFQKEKINKEVIDILENPSNIIWVSQISIFEIVIKIKLGKIPDFPLHVENLINIIKEMGFNIFPIKNEHFSEFQRFPFDENHRDPFDRLIIAATSFEKFTLISNDSKFIFYKDSINLIDNVT